MMSLLLCQVFSLSAVEADESPVGRRLALIIVNSSYPDAKFVAQDVMPVVEALRHEQFEVDSRQNLSWRDMQNAVDALEGKITPRTVVLFIFEGYGLQIAHQTYLLPVDAQVWSESDAKRDGLDLDALVVELNRRGASVKIAVVDASRRNPYERRFRTAAAGLAAVEAPEGTLILFSAAPGKASGDADAGVFMSELGKQIQVPGISAEEAFIHLRNGVSQATNGQQVPWVSSTLVQDFAFVQPSPAEPVQQMAPASQTSPMTSNAIPTQDAEPIAPTLRDPSSGASAPAADTRPALPDAVSDAPPADGPTAPPAPSATLADNKPALSAEPGPDSKPASPAEPTAPPMPGDTVRDCSDCPDLTAIPTGNFDMGATASPVSLPIHRVQINRPFAMSVNAITFRDWDKCLSDGGCSFQPDDFGWGRDQRPVINVSWNDAKTYVAWLSRRSGHVYRLPSEAEWEYAARAGTTTTFAWGPTLGSHMANCRDCQSAKIGRTLPVGQFQPNRYGLNDMSGNVAEWVEDCWNDDYRGAPRDGSAWTRGNCALRVLRGGSFDSPSAYIKPTARFRYDTDVRYYANGFRIVRDLDR